MTETSDRLSELRQRLADLDGERHDLLNQIAMVERELRSSSEPTQGIELDHTGSTSQRSSSAEKIALFRSLFRGRTDVFPRRWENTKTGKSGYAPGVEALLARGVAEVASGGAE